MPHAERANTASFLEECITYIQNLQKRIAELEQLAGLTQATVSHPPSTALPGHMNVPVSAPISFSAPAQQAGGTAVARPLHSQGPLDPPDARDTAPMAGTAVPSQLFWSLAPLKQHTPDTFHALIMLFGPGTLQIER